MKKYYLKPWVERLLETIGVLTFFLLGFDSDDMRVFVIGHLILAGILILVVVVLSKYARKNEE